MKMLGCQQSARRRARRDDDGATRGSDALERVRESDIGTERDAERDAPCRGRGPARACRTSPWSLRRRTASARCLASRTGSRRFGAPPSSRDRRGASRASNAGRTRAMPLPRDARVVARKKVPEPDSARGRYAPGALRGRVVAWELTQVGHRYFWRQTFAEVDFLGGREIPRSKRRILCDDWASLLVFPPTHR